MVRKYTFFSLKCPYSILNTLYIYFLSIYNFELLNSCFPLQSYFSENSLIPSSAAKDTTTTEMTSKSFDSNKKNSRKISPSGVTVTTEVPEEIEDSKKS